MRDADRLDITGQAIPREFINRTLSLLRWLILGSILFITILWPFTTRTGHQVWQLIVLFMLYNLGIEFIRRLVPRLRSFGTIAIVDIVATAMVFYLDYEPGGPLFVLFYLGLICAALNLSTRGTLLYTLAVTVTILAIAPTLPGWSASNEDLRQLSARLIIFALVGAGAALLMGQLRSEIVRSQGARDEAFRLTELGTVRSEFVSTVSHDLQTPITAARAGLGLLTMKASETMDSDERQLLENVQRNIERLNLLLDDLLAYNQIESGNLQLHPEPIDLRSVVTSTISSIQPLIREKQQFLEVDLAEPLLVNGDEHRLEQVIVNLIANAHRHTPSGTRIAVSGYVANGEIRLSVRDTGPGVPKHELDGIFKRFYRLATMGGSSGLGLAIAKALVELHGGKIWAESVEGAGAAFHIALPALSASAGSPIPVTPDTEVDRSSGAAHPDR